VTCERRRLHAGEPDYEGLFAWVALAAFAVAGAIDWTSGLPRLGCVFKAVTGWPCLTCGSTRAVSALFRGDVLGAFGANPLTAVACSASLAATPVALACSLRGWRRLRFSVSPRERAGLRVCAWLAAGATWVYVVAAGH
jgi:hypothetical protein